MNTIYMESISTHEVSPPPDDGQAVMQIVRLTSERAGETGETFLTMMAKLGQDGQPQTIAYLETRLDDSGAHFAPSNSREEALAEHFIGKALVPCELPASLAD